MQKSSILSHTSYYRKKSHAITKKDIFANSSTTIKTCIYPLKDGIHVMHLYERKHMIILYLLLFHHINLLKKSPNNCRTSDRINRMRRTIYQTVATIWHYSFWLNSIEYYNIFESQFRMEGEKRIKVTLTSASIV